MTVAFRAAARLVIVDGDSMSNNPYSTPDTAWPFKVFDGVVPYVKVNRGGFTVAGLVPSRYQRVDPKGNAAEIVGLSFMGGTNSFTLDATGAATYALVTDYQTAAKAAGVNKVVIFTVIPADLHTAPQEAERVAYNDLVIANSGAFDAVVDLTGVTELSDPTNTTYFQVDGTHLKPAGHTIVADEARPVFVTVGLIAA